jgi:hypothetical protein
MIYVDRTKYDRTKSVTFPKYRHLRLGRTQVTARQLEADAVASELAAGKGGVGLQSVAGEDAAAAPNIDVAHCHGDPGPAEEFSPGKDPALDLRGREMSPVANYVRDINGNWKRGVDAFLNIARLCVEANARLTIAQKMELIQALPFGDTAFSKFVQIGSDTRLYAPDIQPLLAPHYTTIYAVTLLTDQELSLAIAEKVLHPGMDRAQLERWRKLHCEKVLVAPIPIEAESDSAVASPRIASTQDAVNSGALPAMSDDSQDNKEELASASDNALAPEAVAPVAGSLASPPSGDIPAFLDRRPLAPEDQGAYDAIKAIWNSHVLPLWKGASAVIRERIIAEVIRANPSGHVLGPRRPN